MSTHLKLPPEVTSTHLAVDADVPFLVLVDFDRCIPIIMERRVTYQLTDAFHRVLSPELEFFFKWSALFVYKIAPARYKVYGPLRTTREGVKRAQEGTLILE